MCSTLGWLTGYKKGELLDLPIMKCRLGDQNFPYLGLQANSLQL